MLAQPCDGLLEGYLSFPARDVIVRLNGWLEFRDWAAVNDLDEGHDCAAGRLRVDARHRGADRASHVD